MSNNHPNTKKNNNNNNNNTNPNKEKSNKHCKNGNNKNNDEKSKEFSFDQHFQKETRRIREFIQSLKYKLGIIHRAPVLSEEYTDREDKFLSELITLLSSSTFVRLKEILTPIKKLHPNEIRIKSQDIDLFRRLGNTPEITWLVNIICFLFQMTSHFKSGLNIPPIGPETTAIGIGLANNNKKNNKIRKKDIYQKPHSKQRQQRRSRRERAPMVSRVLSDSTVTVTTPERKFKQRKQVVDHGNYVETKEVMYKKSPGFNMLSLKNKITPKGELTLRTGGTNIHHNREIGFNRNNNNLTSSDDEEDEDDEDEDDDDNESDDDDNYDYESLDDEESDDDE